LAYDVNGMPAAPLCRSALAREMRWVSNLFVTDKT